MYVAVAGPWTWYWVELVTIRWRWYQQRKVRVEAVIETHSRRQIASIFYKIYPLFLLNVLSRKWNVLWSDLGYYQNTIIIIFIKLTTFWSLALVALVLHWLDLPAKKIRVTKGLNFRGQNQKTGAKTGKQGKNHISLSAAPPVWQSY